MILIIDIGIEGCILFKLKLKMGQFSSASTATHKICFDKVSFLFGFFMISMQFRIWSGELYLPPLTVSILQVKKIYTSSGILDDGMCRANGKSRTLNFSIFWMTTEKGFDLNIFLSYSLSSQNVFIWRQHFPVRYLAILKNVTECGIFTEIRSETSEISTKIDSFFRGFLLFLKCFRCSSGCCWRFYHVKIFSLTCPLLMTEIAMIKISMFVEHNCLTHCTEYASIIK